jgi:hypothetical protein
MTRFPVAMRGTPPGRSWRSEGFLGITEVMEKQQREFLIRQWLLASRACTGESREGCWC